MIDIFFFLFVILMLINNFFKNRSRLKEVTKWQLLGVSITYIVPVFIAFICIYFGINWLADFIANPIVKYIVQFIIVYFVLYATSTLMRKILYTITDGKMPRNI
ncbi:hypothetical protein OEV98_14750 [Caldibacillus lycopersici]|uniref:Uncharacterized protein n=1 Tax=Perspicuibacillus lycopersici TaxID=1325689 RepID=A0AAE3LNJ7_9BACI|nr:hypothetical protein [Perspicuibacillus lycopersici]MCU9614800.1 hypothetical protein [Perspicuibacillus lycopersici]